MVAKVAQSEFDRRFELPGWRIVGNAIESMFAAKSFSSAVAFAQRIADAADTADHHPDLDIRYPGTVRVTVSTHSVRGLSELDAQLAVSISDLARQMEIVQQTTQLQRTEIAIDALEIAAVLPFWRAAMGYIDESPHERGDQVDTIVDPLRLGPPVWFQQMDTARPQRNRVHVDVLVPHDAVDERIAAAIAAGGQLLTDQYAPSFWVLADPEGNEICICTWQNRD